MNSSVRESPAVKQFFTDLWSDGRGPILVATASGWFLSMGVRMIYPILLPHIRTAYDLDLTTAGLLLTVLFFLYGLGQLPGGLLTDYFGERIVLTVSTLISTLTLLLVMSAGSVIVLFTATALFGFGLSLYAVARYTLLGRVYPDQIGSANGIASAASDAGQSLLPPIGGTVFVSTLLGFATITQSYLIASLPDDSQGTGFGLLRTISFSIGAISPVLFGAIADRGFFHMGFMLLAALALVMVVIVHRYAEGM